MKEVNEAYDKTSKKFKDWLDEDDHKEKVKSGLAVVGLHTIFMSLINVLVYLIVAPFYFIFGGHDE